MKLVLAALLAATSLSAVAGSVNGYYRQDGTYVAPYQRSNPNGTATDNYSYRGNVNPYTGNTGTNSYRHDTTSPYYQGPDAYGNSGHGSAYSNQYSPYQ